MGYMFDGCKKLKEIKGINNFKTNKVTNMKGMFQECNELEYLDLSNFNTSNVTDMRYMFSKCHKLKKIKGINNFNISNRTDISNMFDEYNELEYLILSKFNTSNDNKNNFEGLISKLNQEKNKLENELYLERKKIKDILYNKENPIAVNFSSTDQSILFPIVCYNSEMFSKVEEKLYLEFPQLRGKNIYFMANGNIINPSVTVEQNKIKNGTTILINYYE